MRNKNETNGSNDKNVKNYYVELSDDNEDEPGHNIEDEMLRKIQEGDKTIELLNENINTLEDEKNRLE